MAKVQFNKAALKKLEADLNRKLEAASKKNPVPVDATEAEKKRAVKKIVKDASQMK